MKSFTKRKMVRVFSMFKDKTILITNNLVVLFVVCFRLTHRFFFGKVYSSTTKLIREKVFTEGLTSIKIIKLNHTNQFSYSPQPSGYVLNVKIVEQESHKSIILHLYNP